MRWNGGSRVWMGLALLGVATSSCTCVSGADESNCWDSTDDPVASDGSTVEIQGLALHQDGSPLAGLVLLEEPPTIDDLFAAVLTFGLTCLKGDLSGFDCSDYQKLPLDETGRFTTSMPEQNTVGSFGFDRTFVLFVGLPAGGDNLAKPSFVAWARFRRQLVTLPTFALWEPTLDHTTSNGLLQVTFEQPPARTCTAQESVQLEFTDATGKQVWRQAPGDVDLRLLEDTAGALQVRARYNNDAHSAQVDTFDLYSGAVGYTGTAGAPPSRGAACSFNGQPAGACALTDGEGTYTSVADGRAQVDLGVARAIALVALRGYFYGVTLAASSDGQDWTDVASGLGGEYLAVTPSAPLQARYLRLQENQDEQGQQRALAVGEVSVW